MLGNLSLAINDLPHGHVFVDAVLGEPADAVLAEARRFASDLVVLAAPAEQRGGPVPFGREHQPLLVDEFLTWSRDAGDAYVLGSYRGVRGVYRITMAPGIGLRVPELVDRTDAATVEATVTTAGDLILVQDGELSDVQTHEVRSLTLPPGAPRPAGPLVWNSSSFVPSGLVPSGSVP